jgi:hypothetical protein
MSKVVMLIPGEPANVADIDLTLEDMQKVVDGCIEVVYPFSDPVALVCNEEGKVIHLPLNRALRDDDGNVYDIVAGTAFICGFGEEDFTGLTDELAFKYCEMFKMPQTFLNIDGKLFVF